MIPKDIKYNLHYDDVRGDFLQPPHGTTQTTHYENMPIQIYRKFYHKKNENFQIKNSDIFHISAQNIDC